MSLSKVPSPPPNLRLVAPPPPPAPCGVASQPYPCACVPHPWGWAPLLALAAAAKVASLRLDGLAQVALRCSSVSALSSGCRRQSHPSIPLAAATTSVGASR